MEEKDLKILKEIMDVIINDNIIQELIERYLDFDKVKSFSYAWHSFGKTRDNIEDILDELKRFDRDRLKVPIIPEITVLKNYEE